MLGHMDMTTMRTGSGAGPRGRRVQIAIVSPEIVGRIRQAFASKGMSVQIDRLPSLEVTVGPGPGAVPSAAAFGDALSRLVGPEPDGRAAASAHYRLSLVARPGPMQSNLTVLRSHSRDTTEAYQDASSAGTASAGARRSGRALSPREAEVMACISRGMLNAEISARLRLSHKTVKNHVNHIFAKLGARSRVEAVLIWQRTLPAVPDVAAPAA